jgi:hypothetical protein
VGENIDTIQKNTKTLLDASKDIGLEVNPEKNMVILHCKKAGQKHSIKIVNRSFEGVAKFKYLETLKDQNYTNKEIYSTLNLGNACYHSVQSFVLPPAT